MSALLYCLYCLYCCLLVLPPSQESPIELYTGSTKPPADILERLVEIVFKLHKKSNYKNIVLYKSYRRVTWFDDLTKVLQNNISAAYISLVNPTEMTGKMSLSREILVIVEAPVLNENISKNAEVLAELNDSLEGLHASAVLFLSPGVYDAPALRYFLQEQVHKVDFYKIIVVYTAGARLEAYTIEPFIGFEILNRTESLLEPSALFPNPIHDVRGYTLRSPIYYDAPRAFAYKLPSGETKLAGIGVYLLKEFMAHHNGYFDELALPLHSLKKNVHMLEIFNLLKARTIDITPHLYGFFLDGGITMSYPILLTQMCVIAPKKCSSDVTIYAVHADSFTIWWLLLLTTLICAGVAYLSIYYDRESPVLSFGRAFTSSIALLIYQMPCPPIPPILRHVVVLAPMLVFGFFISQLYPAVMLAVQTAGPNVQDIRTVGDFIDAKLNILLPDYERDSILNSSKYTYSEEFSKLILPTNVDTLAHLRTTLNTNYAYAISTERWNFIAAQQTYPHELFQLTEVCFHSYALYLPARKNSPFVASLNLYLLRVAQYGFLQKWEQEAIADGFAAGILRKRKSCPYRARGSTMCSELQQFKFLWIMYGLALACSSVVFLFELILGYFRDKRCRHAGSRNRKKRVKLLKASRITVEIE